MFKKKESSHLFVKKLRIINNKRLDKEKYRQGEPVDMRWAFDGAVSVVFMTRQRQPRNELTDQSFLLACWINSSVLTVYIKL